MVVIIYVYVNTVFGILWVIYFFKNLVGYFSMLFLDTCCLGCLICMHVSCIFVFAPVQRK